MKQKSNETKTIESDEILAEPKLVEPELIILCKHCGMPVSHAALRGISLICPLCGKPQNGHPVNPVLEIYSDIKVLCKHCGEPIEQSKLVGLSLICPLCGKPQNGQQHVKYESKK
ncbi:hypothetical protein JW826_00415 [Candidatus Woesearchaeota archaeon]|nr:hypothetical protein [Candidatus Woesearchaeota archaeon]